MAGTVHYKEEITFELAEIVPLMTIGSLFFISLARFFKSSREDVPSQVCTTGTSACTQSHQLKRKLQKPPNARQSKFKFRRTKKWLKITIIGPQSPTFFQLSPLFFYMNGVYSKACIGWFCTRWKRWHTLFRNISPSSWNCYYCGFMLLHSAQFHFRFNIPTKCSQLLAGRQMYNVNEQVNTGL